MRSATNNKFINVWAYDVTDYATSTCAPSNQVWMLAEIAAAQTRDATANNPLGTYFWPSRPWHRPLGPTQRVGDYCGAGYRSDPEDISIFCNTSAALCADAQQISGCPSAPWGKKLGSQWEYSSTEGKTWFRLPETSLMLDSPKITIGMAGPLTANSVFQQELAMSTIETRRATQFYGVIDSVRVSRGIARYTGQICQPYDPADSLAALIDDYVTFALNVGKNKWQFPGGNVFPFYVKGRGWRWPIGEVSQQDLLENPGAFSLINFYPDIVLATQTTNPTVFIDTGASTATPPVLDLILPPDTTIDDPAGPISSLDPYFQNVWLLLHMEETGVTETTTLDSSVNNRNVIVDNGAELSTTQKKWGNKSAYFSISGNSTRRLLTDITPDLLADSDWTIEFWFRAENVNSGMLFSSSVNDYNGMYGGWYESGVRLSFSTGILVLSLNGANAVLASGMQVNTWYYVTIVKSSNKVSLYLDGAKIGDSTRSFNSKSTNFCIGNWLVNEWNAFSGYIDEFRVTIGTDRDYAGATTAVPAGPFPDSLATPVAPNAPTRLVVQPTIPESLFLSWRKPSFNGGATITDYIIEYTIEDGSPVTVNVGSNATYYALQNLTLTKTYSVRVAAINSVGAGAYCTPVSVAVYQTPPDALYDKVVLLLPMDGNDNTTVFQDMSPWAHQITRHGSAKITSTQSKWGSSGRFDGSGDYLSAPAKNALSFGTGDFTIEFFVRFPSTPTSIQGFLNSTENQTVADTQKWYLLYEPGTGLVFGRHSTNTRSTAAWSPVSNTWYYVVVTRVGGEINMYVDGVAKTVSNKTAFASVNFNNNGITVSEVATPYYSNTYLDDVRVTAAARYFGATIDIPALPFPYRGLVQTTPDAPTGLLAYSRSQQLLLSWRRPLSVGGSALNPYVIEYTPFGGTPTIVYAGTATTYTLSGLTNGTQYTIRVAAVNVATGQGPFSEPVRATPGSNFVNFFEAHKYLTYSNHSAGYRNRCGIQFPMVADKNRDIAQALVVDETLLPPLMGDRIIYVDYATTENLLADFAGDIWGKRKTVDGNEAKPGKIVLVKDQDEQSQNGIYVVQDDLAAGSGSGTPRPWKRILRPSTSTTDDYYTPTGSSPPGARVVVLHGKKNIGTSWYSQTPSPILGETPIVFAQDQLVGVYTDDFCVESYFKVSRFLHPPLNTNGVGMTLLDAYYRDTEKDGGTDNAYSGIRIYFSAEDSGKAGYLFADVGPYDQNPAPANSGLTTTQLSTTGPALRSKLLDTNKFYHVAVTRADDTFRLYLDGVLQDQFTAQDKTFIPLNLSAETNHYRYRVRAYFDTDDFEATQWVRIKTLRSEFFYQRNSVELYAMRFNGAAGMISSTDNKLLNVPTTPGGYASWPGRPIPDYPADAHVYIMNDLSFDTLKPLNFSIRPSLRFPTETLIVELATNQNSDKFVANDGLEYPVPNRGDIELYGIYDGGAPAEGNAVFVMSSIAGFVIPQSTILTANGVEFSPKATYTVVDASPTTTLPAGQLRIQSNGEGNFVVTVPVIALTHGTDGNVPLNTTFTTGSTFANLVRIYAPATFTGGENDNEDIRTIDGVPVSVGMRILVKDQTDTTKNGIYVVGTGQWQRASDMDQSAELKRFQRVFVNGGYVNSNKAYLLKIDNNIPDRNIIIGTTPVTFDPDLDTSASGTKFVASGQQGNCVGTGLEVADEPAAAVTCATTQNVNLFGVPPSSKTDGYSTSVNDIILVKAQTDAKENGIYIITSGNWRRAPYLSKTSQFVNDLLISPVNGNSVPLDGNGKKTAIAYRMQIPTNFVLDQSVIAFTPAVTLDRLYLPFYWRPAFVGIVPDADTGLTLIASGTAITWNDYVPDRQSSAAGANNDKTAWRIRVQCGKTVAYSRSIILRAASALGIQYVQENGVR